MKVASRRSLLGTAALVSLAAPAAALAQSSPGGQKLRLLIHVSENESARWGMAFGNAKNAQDEVGGADKIDIEIVSNGPSVLMLKGDSPMAARIDEALKSGVKIVACENSLKGMKVAKADLHAGVSSVPAGIVELAKKQQDGWSYVRP